MECTNTNQYESFANWTASTSPTSTPRWATNSQTPLAHGTGRLPPQRQALGWQPVAGPGSEPAKRPLTTTMQSLHRRLRGEA